MGDCSIRRWEAHLSNWCLCVAAWFGLAASLAAGCTGVSQAVTGRGGTSGGGAVGQTGGAAGGAPAATGSGGGGGTGGAVAANCDEAPIPLRSAGTILEMPINLVYQGTPFVYGEPNSLPGGVTVTPLNVRFYLSAIELLTASGGSVPVDVVTTSGTVQPYGLFLFNAEDAGAQTLRVLAPPGAYTGVKLAVGIGPACNAGPTAGRNFPLSDASQMTWPHLAGHLFLRYEGKIVVADGSGDAGAFVAIPPMVHMGGDSRDLEHAFGPHFPGSRRPFGSRHRSRQPTPAAGFGPGLQRRRVQGRLVGFPLGNLGPGGRRRGESATHGP